MFPAPLFPGVLFPGVLFPGAGPSTPSTPSTLVYDVFQGDSSGGPVDYTTPVLTTAALSAALAPLAHSTSTRFGLRPRDTATGLSDRNTDATVLIVVGPDGGDRTAVPAAPQALRVVPLAGGTARAEWAWPYLSGPFPTGFRVYLWPASGPPDYTTPAATTAFTGTSRVAFAFSATLSGLADGVDYRVAVRAYNGAGEEQNAVAVSVSGASAPPGDVSSLTATPSY